MSNLDYPTSSAAQRFSGASIVAIICAVGSFFLSFSGHGTFGLIAAIVGILAGVIGFVMAASPRERGGLMSIVSIVLCVIALIPAILVMTGHLVQHL